MYHFTFPSFLQFPFPLVMIFFLSLPLGELGHYAKAAFGDGSREPAPVQLQFTSERLLGRGGCTGHHEQPPGRD